MKTGQKKSRNKTQEIKQGKRTTPKVTSSNAKDPLLIMVSRIKEDAKISLEFRKQLAQKELKLDPIGLLEDHTSKMLDFLNGFDGIPFWDFSHKILQVDLAFDAFINQTAGNDSKYQLAIAKREITELIQHIGFFRDLITSRRTEIELYLKEVEYVNSDPAFKVA